MKIIRITTTTFITSVSRTARDNEFYLQIWSYSYDTYLKVEERKREGGNWAETAIHQQQNTTNTTSIASNQTQGAVPSSMANLTQSDFEELTDNLNAVREAIQDNDLAEAVSELGSAETEVRIFMIQVGAENSPRGDGAE